MLQPRNLDDLIAKSMAKLRRLRVYAPIKSYLLLDPHKLCKCCIEQGMSEIDAQTFTYSYSLYRTQADPKFMRLATLIRRRVRDIAAFHKDGHAIPKIEHYEFNSTIVLLTVGYSVESWLERLNTGMRIRGAMAILLPQSLPPYFSYQLDVVKHLMWQFGKIFYGDHYQDAIEVMDAIEDILFTLGDECILYSAETKHDSEEYFGDTLREYVAEADVVMSYEERQLRIAH